MLDGLSRQIVSFLAFFLLLSVAPLFSQDATPPAMADGAYEAQRKFAISLLNQQKHLQKLEVRGNSYLRTMNPGHSAEVHSVDMDFFLDKDQRLESAIAIRDTKARSLDSDSEMQMSGAKFRGLSALPDVPRCLT